MNTRSFFLSAFWRVFLALILSLSVAGISARQARASAYNIVSNLNDSGLGSLRAAITATNTNPGADTITFTVSGVIGLASSLPAITEDLTINGSGQNITITGNVAYRVFYVNSGLHVTIRDLWIACGYISSGNGGGIYNEGTLIVQDVNFISNQASYAGGAIYNYHGTLSVYDSTFSTNYMNTPTGNGAAIYNNGGTLSVTNSTFHDNNAYNGGGIVNYNGSARVTNSTFAGNEATLHGGGIYSTNSSLYLGNTILADSVAPEDCYSDAALSSDTNNLIEVNSGCGSPISSADPKLGPYANNGGFTWTFALLPGSPAFDAGDDATCAAAPVSSLDQRGVTRPRGAHCDIGSYEMDKGRLTVNSVGTLDGWILEASENSSIGGTLNATTTTFQVGDGASDKQYRAILSFNTAVLPDTAVLTRVILKIRYQGLVGTDPFTILGGLKVDMRKPYFGTGAGLVAADFHAAAGKSNAATFRTTPVNNWYTAVIGAAGYPFINLTGSSQFRLHFATDDNDDLAADYMKFFSGDHTNAAARPTLVIDYDIP